jgi:hypothetical protein
MDLQNMDINPELREVRRSTDTPEEKRHKIDALKVANKALLKSEVLESKAVRSVVEKNDRKFMKLT